jgi:transcriptional regulator with XRE-family HTH domain
MPYTENQIAMTKERLENLRRDVKKLSLKQLSELLKEQGVLISHTNLKNYEINDQYHSLYNRTKGMSLENFVALADVFDVSVDYLLGRSNSKKAEYRQMSEELQLGDETIDLLKIIIEEDSDNPDFGRRIMMLNKLLLDPDILSALALLRDACYSYDIHRAKNSGVVAERKMQDKKLEEAEKYLERYGLRAVDAAVVGSLFISQALALIDRVVRKFPADFVEEYYKLLAEDDWEHKGTVLLC